jgi:ABC-type branched-subunit amino acid transport system permease subunit
VLPFLVKNYRVFQFNLVLVYAIAMLGLNILTGFNGQISLGHGAFYAIGAYARGHPDGPRACPTGPRCRSPVRCASASAS